MASKKKPPARKPGPVDYSKPTGPGKKIPPLPPKIPTGTTGEPGVGLGDPGSDPGAPGVSRPVVVYIEPELLGKAAAEALNFGMPAGEKKNLHKVMAQLTGVEIASGQIGRKARYCIIGLGVLALAVPTVVSTISNIRKQRERQEHALRQDRGDVSGAGSSGGSGSDNGSEAGSTVRDMEKHVDQFR